MLTDQWVNAEQTQTLGGVIAAQMGSLQDLKSYVTAAATGMLSSSGFIWLVTDGRGRLGVVATYGAGTLLVGERRQSLSPDVKTEFGGVYVPAGQTAPGQTQTPPITSPAFGLAPPLTSTPPGVRPLSTSASVRGPNDSAAHPANVWSHTSYSGFAGTGGNGYGTGGPPDVPLPEGLDTLGATLFPLFCVSVHEHAWMAAGYGVWGKETYLERFWSCLDWTAVKDAYASYALRARR